jgi:hypothetical protein
MHCNILNLLGLNFDFCDFCAFLRLYLRLYQSLMNLVLYRLHGMMGKNRYRVYCPGLASFQSHDLEALDRL